MIKNKSNLKLKKYQTRKFDYYKTLNEYYLENNEAYISIKVDSINDIISKYSIKNDEILNYEFMRYLETNASYIPSKYKLVLEICNHKFTDKEKQIIEKVIRNHYGISLINKKEELNLSKRKGLFLLITGLISLLIFSILLYSNILSVLQEICSLLFCFALWEYAESKIFTDDELKEEILDLKNLSEIKIIFKED